MRFEDVGIAIFVICVLLCVLCCCGVCICDVCLVVDECTSVGGRLCSVFV